MVFAEESTTAAFLLRARREGIRDFGACMAPMTAFQILQGIETLPLRMQRHVDNTRKIVAFLAAHPLVESVGYPELPTHRDHALAQKLLPRGCGAVFSFAIRGTREQGRRFIEVVAHLLAPRQRRRRQVAGDPSREHDALSRERRRSARRRASPRARFGFRSVSKMSTTSSRICRARPARGRQGLSDAMRLEVAGHDGLRLHRRARVRRRVADDRLRSWRSERPQRLGAAVALLRASWRRTCWRSTCPDTAAAAATALRSVHAIADWLVALLDAIGVDARHLRRPQHGRAGSARRGADATRSGLRVSRCSRPRCR